MEKNNHCNRDETQAINIKTKHLNNLEVIYQ